MAIFSLNYQNFVFFWKFRNKQEISWDPNKNFSRNFFDNKQQSFGKQAPHIQKYRLIYRLSIQILTILHWIDD
jgi:hypothetical protein